MIDDRRKKWSSRPSGVIEGMGRLTKRRGGDGAHERGELKTMRRKSSLSAGRLTLFPFRSHQCVLPGFIGFIICIVQLPCVRQLGPRSPEPALRSFLPSLSPLSPLRVPVLVFFPSLSGSIALGQSLDPQRATPFLSLRDGSPTHSVHGIQPALRRCRTAVNHALCVWCILLLCRTLIRLPQPQPRGDLDCYAVTHGITVTYTYPTLLAEELFCLFSFFSFDI